MVLERLTRSQKEEDPQKQDSDGTEFMDETNLDYADTDYLVSGTAVPEKNAEYALNRFVEDGPVSVEHFSQTLEDASDVWEAYLERDEHSPRDIDEDEAMAYGAGAAAASGGFVTNSPRYSDEVEREVEEVTEKISDSLKSEYGSSVARELGRSLLGPEEIAEAETHLRDKGRN